MPRPGPTTYKYSEEFKATAVRLGNLPGVEVQDVVESLHIHPFMLSQWHKKSGMQLKKYLLSDKHEGRG